MWGMQERSKNINIHLILSQIVLFPAEQKNHTNVYLCI